MGGCRCTYRNCTVRTDGSTHMFHYPVFDKVRCHQWLTNAHKLEFLNLKVSQLKNRVVCQNHFKDEYFMNFKKDKLTFEAVPTLDGPYCDSSQYADKDNSQEVAKMYPISLDDIETEYLTLYDKKANFSVKYGDFLTNCEVMDVDPIKSINSGETHTSIKNNHVEQNNDEPSYINLNEGTDKLQNTTINVSNHETSNDNKQIESQLTVLNPYNVYQLVSPVVVGVEFDKMQGRNNNQKNGINNNNKPEASKENKSITNQVKLEVQTPTPKNKKIKILSEKKILPDKKIPVPLTGKLEPVSPSLILHLPNKRKINKTKPENDTADKLNNYVRETASEVSIENKQNDLQKTYIQTNRKVLTNTLNNEVSPGKSLLKPKVNSDRVAAIERKRKFNMKLRDVIELSLDKIDEQNNEPIESSTNIKNNERVSTFLSKKSGLPSVQEYTIACLEARMKRMEDILSIKIDQNTQRIKELKKFFGTPCDKKTVATQVINNEEHHKKQLYTEISKYLSPDANNLIYEELFINKYVQNTSKSAPSPKRRRRR